MRIRFVMAGTAVLLAFQTVGAAGASADSEPSERLRQAAYTEPLQVTVGNRTVDFPLPPVVDNGSTLVPARALLEQLGFRVDWDPDERAVLASKEGLEIRFAMGEQAAAVNGQRLELPVSSRLVEQTAFIPLRFAAEADGREVLYNSFSQQIWVRAQGSLRQIRAIALVDQPFLGSEYTELSEKLSSETGLKFQLTPIGPEHYREKVNVMIAANDMPDLLLLSDPFMLDTPSMEGLFWDITSYLDEYPHLKSIPDEAWNGIRRDNGKLLGIPRYKSPYDLAFPAIRKDWLDKIGLKVPETMDELFVALKTMVDRDADGNGKHDTLPLAGVPDAAGLGGLAWVENVFNESAGRFKVQDGRVIDTVTEPGTRQALQWLQRAFAEGLLLQDFAISSGQQVLKQVTDGRVSAAAYTLKEAASVTETLRKTVRDANLAPIPYLKSPGGQKVVPYGPSHTGMFVVPKSGSESKLRLILSFLDSWMAQGSADIRLESFFGYSPESGFESQTSIPEPALQEALAALNQREQIGFTGSLPSPSLFTREVMAKLSKTTSEIQKMKIKVILGGVSIVEWDAFVDKLKRDADYQSAIAELNRK